MVELRDTVSALSSTSLKTPPTPYSSGSRPGLTGCMTAYQQIRPYQQPGQQYGLFPTIQPITCCVRWEILNDDGELERKADMFTKRTIKRREPVTHVDTAQEALAVSIAEKACVDLGFMHSLSSLPHEQIVAELEGVIYRVPAPDADTTELWDAQWQAADEYLSGNVREKLAYAEYYAEQYPGLFDKHVEALKAAQPKELEAQEISVRLGAEWIGTEYVQQFMEHLLEAGRV